LLVALLPLALATPLAAATWDIDTAHSTVGFVAKHLVFAKVRGHFDTWGGTVVIDEKDITKSSVDVKIVAASITTDNEKRDVHLKSADFFDVEKYKDITFKSTKVEKGTEPGTLKVTGNLTLHGVTKPVVLALTGPSPEFKDPGGNAHIAFSGTTKVNRKDFGLNWSMAVEAAPVVGDDVILELEIEHFKKR
jgi:polyisoprenoid-binding protein YceI